MDLDIVYIFLVCYSDFHLVYKRISKSTSISNIKYIKPRKETYVFTKYFCQERHSIIMYDLFSFRFIVRMIQGLRSCEDPQKKQTQPQEDNTRVSLCNL